MPVIVYYRYCVVRVAVQRAHRPIDIAFALAQQPAAAHTQHLNRRPDRCVRVDLCDRQHME